MNTWNTKKHANSVHFRSRMRNRFGLDVSLSDELYIADKIKKGEGFQYRLSNNRTLNKFFYKNMIIWIIYDKKTKHPVTALTDSMVTDLITRLQEEKKHYLQQKLAHLTYDTPVDI